LRIVAAILKLQAIEKILNHLGLGRNRRSERQRADKWRFEASSEKN
jgi:hypothetical protein